MTQSRDGDTVSHSEKSLDRKQDRRLTTDKYTENESLIATDKSVTGTDRQGTEVHSTLAHIISSVFAGCIYHWHWCCLVGPIA